MEHEKEEQNQANQQNIWPNNPSTISTTSNEEIKNGRNARNWNNSSDELWSILLNVTSCIFGMFVCENQTFCLMCAYCIDWMTIGYQYV